jgi:hyperosmotically inducible periplasmic protein
MRLFPLIMLMAIGLVGCNDADRSSTVSAPKADQTEAAVDRDNTAVNKRDREATAKTPMDQKENKKDIDVSADIRKKVVDTKMSVTAHNVKIITQDGKVTLRGPVKSDDEKKQIEEIARSVAGNDNVDSQLEVEKQP